MANTSTASAWSWKNEPELMARLGAAQNHPANVNQDIMTFAGLMNSREEFERHLAFYEQKAANWMPKPRRRKVAVKGTPARVFMANLGRW